GTRGTFRPWATAFTLRALRAGRTGGTSTTCRTGRSFGSWLTLQQVQQGSKYRCARRQWALRAVVDQKRAATTTFRSTTDRDARQRYDRKLVRLLRRGSLARPAGLGGLRPGRRGRVVNRARAVHLEIREGQAPPAAQQALAQAPL